MDNTINTALCNQFGAALTMLENAFHQCPDAHWDTEIKFWYKAYHCLCWTDYFLTIEPKEFVPPHPFTLSEFDQTMPEASYTKQELLTYLQHCRQKANALISNLTLEQYASRWINQFKNYSLLEIILYNLRHVQHHAAQLNLHLRQQVNNAPGWISQASIGES